MLARRSIAKPDELAYSPAHPSKQPSPTWYASPAAAGRSRNASRARRTNAAPDQYEVRRYVGWYRHITLVMLAHAFLTVLAGQERKKGAPSGTHPTPWTSDRPKFDVCWQLGPAAALRTATTR
ncbi:hypothetical protein RKD48_002145 [Streptomyces ambofaciens]